MSVLKNLQTALNKTHKEPYKYTINRRTGRHQISYGDKPAGGGGQVCLVWQSHKYPAEDIANFIVAAHNDLPEVYLNIRKLLWWGGEASKLLREAGYSHLADEFQTLRRVVGID